MYCVERDVVLYAYMGKTVDAKMSEAFRPNKYNSFRSPRASLPNLRVNGFF